MNSTLQSKVPNSYADTIASLTRPELTAPEVEGSPSLSPNYVIEFARIRTAHINAWLDNQLGSMRTAAAETQALNDVLAVVAHYHALPSAINTPEDHAKLKNAIDAGIKSLPPGSRVRDKLLELHNEKGSLLNTDGKGGADTTVVHQELEAMKTQLDTMLKSVDRGSQEAQLFINQKIGEKNEIMQLAAMLIQQLHEISKGILQRA